MLIGLAVVKVAKKKNVIVEMISILVVYMLLKLDYFFVELIFLLFVVVSCVGSIIVLLKISSIALLIY